MVYMNYEVNRLVFKTQFQHKLNVWYGLIFQNLNTLTIIVCVLSELLEVFLKFLANNIV